MDTKEVKRRSRELTAYIESYRPHDALVGTTQQKVWVTDVAKDKVSLVGAHTKSYVQVLLPGGEENKARLMGKSAEVRIIDAHRWHVTGELIEVHDRTAPETRGAARAQVFVTRGGGVGLKDAEAERGRRQTKRETTPHVPRAARQRGDVRRRQRGNRHLRRRDYNETEG